MDLITGLVAGALLALFTAIRMWINKGRFDGIERRLDHMSAEIAALRSDMLQVALAATGRREPN